MRIQIFESVIIYSSSDKTDKTNNIAYSHNITIHPRHPDYDDNTGGFVPHDVCVLLSSESITIRRKSRQSNQITTSLYITTLLCITTAPRLRRQHRCQRLIRRTGERTRHGARSHRCCRRSRDAAVIRMMWL